MGKTYENARSIHSLSGMTLGVLLAGACLTGTSTFAQTTAPRPNDVYAVNAGGGAIDGWTADSNFFLGNTYVNNGQPVSLANLPSDDAPAAVYQDGREGDHFSYAFTTLKPNTVYQVTLHFAELYWSDKNKREFNVTMNGNQVLTDFDIVANAGGPFKATAMQFFILSDKNGVIEIDFTRGAVDQPIVNAIEIATLLAG